MNLNLNPSILAYKLYTLTTLVITLVIIGQIVPIQINMHARWMIIDKCEQKIDFHCIVAP